MNKLSWYEAYSISLALNETQMTKEAGIKENLSGLALALSLFFGGQMDAEAAAKKANVNKTKVEHAIKQIQQSKKPTNKTPNKSTNKTPNKSTNKLVNLPLNNQNVQKSNIKMTSLIPAILSHENLLPKQTPFRITSKGMRKWSKIYGFEIDNKTPKPSNRQNFIFLKNEEDVPKAVTKLFENYKNNPQKYGLTQNSTLKQVIEKFDQTGSHGKMETLKSKFPSLNLNLPLSSFF